MLLPLWCSGNFLVDIITSLISCCLRGCHGFNSHIPTCVYQCDFSFKWNEQHLETWPESVWNHGPAMRFPIQHRCMLWLHSGSPSDPINLCPAKTLSINFAACASLHVIIKHLNLEKDMHCDFRWADHNHHSHCLCPDAADGELRLSVHQQPAANWSSSWAQEPIRHESTKSVVHHQPIPAGA